jgi:hypothetical protein
MSIGNLGAAPGAQPSATQALGAPIWQDTGPAAGSAPVGNAGNPAPTGGVTYFNASYESVLAAVSRGEVSLNQVVANGSQFGGLNNGPAGSNLSAGNPTLLQAISQGLPQNGTNGLNGIAAGGGTVNSSYASCNNAPGTFDQGFDSTATIDPKQVMNAPGVQLVSPAQYGGN